VAGGSAEMSLRWDKDTYQFQNFLLQSTAAGLGNVQEIRAEGIISLDGKKNFNLQISNLKLHNWGQTFKYPIPFDGRLSMDLQLQGEAMQPEISSTFTILDGHYNQFPFQRITGKIDYQNERLRSDIAFRRTDLDSLTFSASLPVQLSFSQPADTFFYLQKPLEIRMHTDHIPLTLLEPFVLIIRK